MLNSTKTWQKRFDEAFGVYWSNYKNTLYRCNPNDILDRPSIINSEDIKQFISDLRKRDMEALIEMLPKDDNSETFLYRNRVKKIIKDYYDGENNGNI